jgi:predicted unusual protein kinase regulating ubiquinone biosynthesis (AarF/ABC1/UbiB family)
VATYLVNVLRAARRNGLRIPPSLLSMYRTLLAAETVAHELGATTDLGMVGRHFFERLHRDEMARRLRPREMEGWLADVSSLVSDGPRRLQQLLADVTDDRLSLSVRTLASDTDRADGRERARLITMAIVLVALAVLLVGSDRLLLPPQFLRPLLAIALIAGGVKLMVLWRRLR